MSEWSFEDQLRKASYRVPDLIKPYLSEYELAIKAHNKLTGNPIDQITGNYPVNDDVEMVITNEPVEVLLKSAGRSWMMQSCERLDTTQECQHGPFGDIEQGAGIVLFHHIGENEPFARTMIRWCEKPDGERDIGIEPKMYPLPKGRGFDAVPLMDALVTVVEDAGFGCYDKCRTPYRVKGYSHMGEDEAAKPMNINVTYTQWWKNKRRYNP